jgi:hypothetical protein
MILIFLFPLLILFTLLYGHFKKKFHYLEKINLVNMASIYFHIDFEKKSYYWYLIMVIQRMIFVIIIRIYFDSITTTVVFIMIVT